MYLILKVLKQNMCDYKHKEPAFIVVHDDNDFSIVPMTYHAEFAPFFNEYVNACYKSLQNRTNDCSKAGLEDKVLVSCLSPEKMRKFEREMPVFYLSPLEKMQKMEISTTGFLETVDWQKFTEELQTICDLGTI